ncbi:MAG: sigma 54-interacting transcriptional regulator [Sandaracinus sp.]
MPATTAPTPPRDAAPPSVHRIVVAHSPSSAQDLARFVTKTMIVGRGPGDSGLTIDDPELSRAHAAFEVDESGRLVVRDLESRNGTWVGGRRLVPKQAHPLASGDVIRLGATLIVAEHLRYDQLDVLRAPPRTDGLVGQSVAFLGALAHARAVAVAPLPVLIHGETGVGKEVFAREVHRASGRTGPLVPVNCAALPDALVESELFGHERGAYTGAERRSDGLFGEAEGGTIFLDEIGEMPTVLQAKLLRVLATGEVRAVGSTKARRVDVRVVAATNVDVERAIGEGAFRGDLFARLSGAVVEVPPLRARRDDVLRLARAVLARVTPARRNAASHDVFSPDAAEALLLARWTFNVRELEQRMLLLASLVPSGRIELGQLPAALRVALDERVGARTAISAEELALLEIPSDRAPSREELVRVLGKYAGNVSQTAAFFGKDRRQIYRWAERFGIQLDEARE